MNIFEWEEVLTSVLSMIASLIIGWIAGFFKGKKKSQIAIERKNTLYLPLIEELGLIGDTKLNVLTDIKSPILTEIISNDYKYGLRKKIQEKCVVLHSLIEQFNKINLVSVAHDNIVDIFETSFEELFGSIIDGVSMNYDREGNVWEELHLVEPVEMIRKGDFSKEIINLLKSEGMYDSGIYIDKENSIVEPIYGDLVSIFNSVLNVSINGIAYKMPPLKRELEVQPAEYMASNYDFFKEFNTNLQTIQKYKLKKEIISNAQDISYELKELIRKIVEVYETEEV